MYDLPIKKVFDIEWFLKHQRIILWFANTSYGRDVLYINGNKSDVLNRKIIQILPNSITWFEDYDSKDCPLLTTEFRVNEKFARRLFYEYRYVWQAFHWFDMKFANNFAPQLNLGFDTTGDLFPAAGANSPVDGWVARDINPSSETFSTIRGSAGNNSIVTDVSKEIQLRATSTTDQYDLLIRHIYCFDTSPIGSGGTIDSAIFSLASSGTTKVNTLGSPAIHVAGATPANTNNLVNADYGQVQTTSFGSVTFANWSIVDGTYNDFSLNASGLTNISKTGISKFSVQLSWDILNDTTGLTWASGGQSYVIMYLADQAGTTTDPKLVVTYTPPVAVGQGWAWGNMGRW